MYRRIPYRCYLACIFDAARWSTTIRASPPFRDRNHRDFAPSRRPGQAECSRPGLLLALIHRSAQKGNSANSALTEFSEIRNPFATVK